MSDERTFLTVDQALSVLPPGDGDVHTFVNPGPGMLIGADWRRETAERAIRDAELLELAGPGARGMEHGLVVHQVGGRLVYVATDEAALTRIEAEAAPAPTELAP